MNEISLKIPGRICLFGDKIDLLGKPVIAASIEKFMYFNFKPRNDNKIRFYSEDFPEEEEIFDISDKERLFNQDRHLKYWHACLKSLENDIDDGKIKGFSATVKSDIPIGAGLSSSAAVCVGFLKGLSIMFDLGLSKADIAEHAYHAEHDILNIMCGRMDQYSISYGGVTFISTGDTPSVENINVDRIPLVIGDSQEPREAKKILNRVKRELENGNELYLKVFDEINNIVHEGKKILENSCDLKEIGMLMSRQQEQENLIDTATKKINLMCKTAIEHGAFGAKQMGAGGGGCMLACCPNEEVQKSVAKSLIEAGGTAEMANIFRYSNG
ncbi:MAG: mevalonate kinase family protein [Promethearchaeota archaeon]